MHKLNINKLVLIVLVCSLGVTATLIAFAPTHHNQTPATNQITLTPTAQTIEPTITSLSSRLMFFGDMYWGRDTNRYAQANPLKEAYPFSRLHEFDRAKYDAWIANLECPSVPGVTESYYLAVNRLVFNCSTSYLKQASKWFTAVSNANNHSANQGSSGLQATRGALKANGIQYFGDSDPEKLNNVCKIITVGARIFKNDGSSQNGQLPIAMCGYHGLAKVPSAKSLAVIKTYAKYLPVFTYPHLGIEYTSKPTTTQINLYHAMINNGANAVFGGHPHWVQSAEAYKHKLIIYSMGDFMFDQLPGETQRGLAIDLTLSLDKDTINQSDLAKWLKLGDQCNPYHDDCLNQIKLQHLTKLPFKFQYKMVGVSATKTPAPATKAETTLILDRLNWAKISQDL